MGTFDFAYIDADHTKYQVYTEKIIALLKTNGYMLIDNTLWAGGAKPPNFTTDI